jgi:putative ABC transport system ATP-binding protein
VPDLVGQNLNQTFGQGPSRTSVLIDVNVELRRGEFTLLMGPSGSGKSTLLAILSSLARPSSGRVLALGRDLGALSEGAREQFRLRHCGFVFQQANLFPSLTAREQLEMVIRWGERASKEKAARRVGDMLAELGLDGKGDLMPAQLSGGEKGRVAVARALIKRPALCFADEPTAALDWGTGRHVVEVLRRAAHGDNTLVLVVSHDPRIIPFADRVFSLSEGRLSEGPPVAPEPIRETSS